ncbi:hypothetical protein MTYM_02247 [Methylococcales bacterium]|nr:hypothetical protein MTYM_02247 [Methylococcales bacterium]
MIREAIIKDLIRDKDVLDIGSVGQSDEYSLWKLYQDSNLKSLTGIDLPNAKNVAKEEFHLNNMNNDTRIVFGNMETHQFGHGFDVIVAGDVIEHVENQGHFLRNIWRHLNDDGKLILTTPNAKWPTVFFKPNITHTFWHDKYTLARISELTGFEIEFFRYYYGNKPSYPFALRPLLLRQSLLVICRKSQPAL